MPQQAGTESWRMEEEHAIRKIEARIAEVENGAVGEMGSATP